MLVWGVWTRPKIQKSWNLKFWALKVMKSLFYCTNLKPINSRKLLKVLFKHISPINDPKVAIISLISFLWFPHDFPVISLNIRNRLITFWLPYFLWNYFKNTRKCQIILKTTYYSPKPANTKHRFCWKLCSKVFEMLEIGD